MSSGLPKDRPPWIGSETADYDFDYDVVVTGGSVLTLNTRLSFSGTLCVEKGSEVVIDDEADVWMTASTLELSDSTRLIVRGTLTAAGAIRKGRGAEIIYSSTYTTTATGHTADAIGPAFNVEAPYPNPFKTRTTLRYSLSESSAVERVKFPTSPVGQPLFEAR